MEDKGGVEEKRVKSTIIRRRTVQAEKPRESLPAAAEPEEAKGPLATRPVATPETAPPEAPSAAASNEASPEGTPVPQEARGEVKPKKVGRRKTRDELEMELIARAGGLKKVVETIEVMPERMERVYRPGKSSKKRRVVTRREFKKTELTTPKAIKKVIRIESRIAVGELAHRMGVKAGDLVRKLMDLGVMATVNQVLDAETAMIVAHDFGYEVENVAFEEKVVLKQELKGENRQPRSPVVTVMGHVDHGKTSLLDWMRKSRVAAGEAGGITQHIGAYTVKTPKGKVTFLDTPGHEAFTLMRARGAKLTDLVILVVAGDEGVKAQTIEAINHAKAAKVPILVAVNKMDRPDADRARVERQLMEHGLVSEKLGGETIFVPLSAKTGQGVDDLLEMILLQAEVLQLGADSTGRAHGVILESRLDRGRGPVATLIVQEGTLRRGDPIVAGQASGRIRALLDSEGNSVEEALPSMPVEIVGLSELPQAGDQFDVASSEEDARAVATHRVQKRREVRDLAPKKLEELYEDQARQLSMKELKVVIKADVHGSAEALKDAIGKLSTEKVKASVLHWGVGGITESDVMLAITSQALLIGFNTRPDNKGRELAEREKVPMRSFSIIYEVLDDIRRAMTGLLEPVQKEEYLGRAEVKQLFRIAKVGTVAGVSVVDGKILRTAPARVLREGKIVYQGRLASLKRFKEDAREVLTGLECGIGIENYNDLKVGDLIESYQISEIPPEL